jgi:hypothetical protein
MRAILEADRRPGGSASLPRGPDQPTTELSWSRLFDATILPPVVATLDISLSGSLAS